METTTLHDSHVQRYEQYKFVKNLIVDNSEESKNYHEFDTQDYESDMHEEMVNINRRNK